MFNDFKFMNDSIFTLNLNTRGIFPYFFSKFENCHDIHIVLLNTYLQSRWMWSWSPDTEMKSLCHLSSARNIGMFSTTVTDWCVSALEPQLSDGLFFEVIECWWTFARYTNLRTFCLPEDCTSNSLEITGTVKDQDFNLECHGNVPFMPSTRNISYYWEYSTRIASPLSNGCHQWKIVVLNFSIIMT